jgi:hypothetical protein
MNIFFPQKKILNLNYELASKKMMGKTFKDFINEFLKQKEYFSITNNDDRFPKTIIFKSVFNKDNNNVILGTGIEKKAFKIEIIDNSSRNIKKEAAFVFAPKSYLNNNPVGKNFETRIKERINIFYDANSSGLTPELLTYYFDDIGYIYLLEFVSGENVCTKRLNEEEQVLLLDSYLQLGKINLIQDDPNCENIYIQNNKIKIIDDLTRIQEKEFTNASTKLFYILFTLYKLQKIEETQLFVFLHGWLKDNISLYKDSDFSDDEDDHGDKDPDKDNVNNPSHPDNPDHAEYILEVNEQKFEDAESRFNSLQNKAVLNENLKKKFQEKIDSFLSSEQSNQLPEYVKGGKNIKNKRKSKTRFNKKCKTKKCKTKKCKTKKCKTKKCKTKKCKTKKEK